MGGGRSFILPRCLSKPALLGSEKHVRVNFRASREETSLRAPNNYVFPSDSLIMTVAHWYQVYSRPEFRDTYIVLPKQCQRKGKTNSKTYAFSVELYINVGQVRSTFLVSPVLDSVLIRLQYTARTEDPELLGVGRAGTKRKTSATQFAGANTGSQGSKRFRGSSPLSHAHPLVVTRFLQMSFPLRHRARHLGPFSSETVTFLPRHRQLFPLSKFASRKLLVSYPKVPGPRRSWKNPQHCQVSWKRNPWTSAPVSVAARRMCSV